MTYKTLTSWKDISIRQYIALYNLDKTLPEPLKDNPTEDDITDYELQMYDFMLKKIGILYGLNESKVENIPMSHFQTMKSEMEFTSTEPETCDIKNEIIIDGTTYKLKEDLGNIKLGEWVDFEAFNKDSISNLNRILALLYKKEGLDKYIPSEVDEAAEAFLDNVDIQTCLAAFFLFYLFALNFIPSDIQDTSMFQKAEMEIQKLKIEMNQNNQLKELLVA